MMGKRFARVVEECLHRLDRGENLPDILADFPAEAEQLKPLLLVAMASRSMTIPVPSQTAQRLGRNQMLAAMDQVGLPVAPKKVPFHRRVIQGPTRLMNTLRAQALVRQTPSYRLAMIALVVVFGSGLFAVSAFASPVDLLTAFTADIQGIGHIFNRQSSEDSQDFFDLFKIFSDNFSPFPAKQAAKVAFQLDFTDDTNNAEFAFGAGGRNPSPSQGNGPGQPPKGIPDPTGPPEEDPADNPDQDSDPKDTLHPSPFPGNAADVVNLVVSDTAKEKNPVWDQLPFNQTDDGDDEGDAAQPDDGEDEANDGSCSDDEGETGDDEDVGDCGDDGDINGDDDDDGEDDDDKVKDKKDKTYKDKDKD